MLVELHIAWIPDIVAALRNDALADRLTKKVAERYRRRYEDVRAPQGTRYESLATGLLLATVLAVHRDRQLVIDAYGKPALADASSSISISHGGDVAVLAVSARPQERIGVDVEPIASGCEAAAVYLPPADRAWIAFAPRGGEERARRFACAWTRLEALVKADGRGFSVDPRKGAPQGFSTSSIEYRGHLLACAASMPPELRIVPWVIPNG